MSSSFDVATGLGPSFDWPQRARLELVLLVVSLQTEIFERWLDDRRVGKPMC